MDCMSNTKKMLLTGVIGCGNAGSQVADLAQDNGFDCFIINSSIRDMSTVNFTQERMAIIGEGRGVGKDRRRSKEYMKLSIKEQVINAKVFKDFMNLKEVVFIVSSTGGGTGSGLAPTLLNLLQHLYPNTKFILVGILPTDNESYDTLENTVQYMQELNKLNNVTYMSYDNNKAPSRLEGKKYINEQIVEDFKVIRGDYIDTALNDAIDENDMATILSYPGRLVVGRVNNIDAELPLNELILDSISNNSYSTDISGKKVAVYGIMSSLTVQLATKFDDNIIGIRKKLGEARLFKNIAKSTTTNKIAVIANGLNMITTKMNEIVDRVNEMKLEIEEQNDTVINDNWSSYIVDDTDTTANTNTTEEQEFDMDAFLAGI